ncbi:MAG: hypothetical protein JEZ03_09705 [Bacteroidales bacterium]|nr:hypothetical protein [Bacteroidales bacterium]
MSKLSIILPLLLVMISCNGSENQTPDLKRYEVKSGIVKYVTTISGKVMGSTISGNGTEDLYFKNWGAVELKEVRSSETNQINVFGQKKTETKEVHSMNKLDDGESYYVDFDNKQIIAGRDMAMDMIKMFDPNADAGAVGKNMLEGLGGKKVGTESILGFSCELWEIPGGKQWLYKGVVLKMEMTVMGIKTVTQAQSADFDISVADRYFSLPDFPIQKQESVFDEVDFNDDMEDMDADMEKLSKMSYQEWKKIALSDREDDEIQNMSEAELREMYDMMQKMVKMRMGN